MAERCREMNNESKNNSVYIISMIFTLIIVAWGLFSPSTFDSAAKGLFNFLIQDFGWGYMLAMSIFVVFPICLACSRFGKLKLGPDDSKPEFSTISWFAMLFPQEWVLALYFMV